MGSVVYGRCHCSMDVLLEIFVTSAQDSEVDETWRYVAVVFG